MRLLLDGRLHPLTDEIGFLEADPRTVMAAYLDWQRPLKRTYQHQLEERAVDGTLEERLRSLAPLTATPCRHLFVATSSAWTAYFANGRNGGDVFGRVSYLPELIGCRGLRLVATPDQKKPLRYGARIFSLYGPEPGEWLNTIRSIECLNDGGRWRCDDVGFPLPFEDVDAFGAQRAKDRFSFETLEKYAGALGLRPFDEDFYSGPAVLLEERGPGLSREPTFPLPGSTADSGVND